MAARKKAVFWGELLMRLGTKQNERFVQATEFCAGFTGAEANVAVSLVNYGVDCYMVSSVPANEIGQACINHIRQFGVDMSGVKRTGSRLGMFYLENGASQRPSKVIYDRAGSSITELKAGAVNWREIFAGKDWFHFSGTAPALGDNVAEITREACIAAKECKVTVSCDLNYRKKLWSSEKARQVMTGLMDYVDVLIANEEDAHMVFGIKAREVDVTSGNLQLEPYKDVAGQLHNRFGVQYVAITLRESLSASDNNWSGLLYDGKEYHHSTKYRIHIVDRVGGGDSFSGGLIYGLLSGMTGQETIEFAAAASCLKHSVQGDFNLVSLDEVMALMKGDASGRIQR
ncbi:MAG: sugar kinase [Victivallales bacterium]|nr:sugar kinase [Victivallales bacterium]